MQSFELSPKIFKARFIFFGITAINDRHEILKASAEVSKTPDAADISVFTNFQGAIDSMYLLILFIQFIELSIASLIFILRKHSFVKLISLELSA